MASFPSRDGGRTAYSETLLNLAPASRRGLFYALKAKGKFLNEIMSFSFTKDITASI